MQSGHASRLILQVALAAAQLGGAAPVGGWTFSHAWRAAVVAATGGGIAASGVVGSCK
jgi:hypothetical protein